MKQILVIAAVILQGASVAIAQSPPADGDADAWWWSFSGVFHLYLPRGKDARRPRQVREEGQKGLRLGWQR